MTIHPAVARNHLTAARIASAVIGSFLVLLVLLAAVRPEMMNMAMLHRLTSAAGL